jgi:hypothetical protein
MLSALPSWGQIGPANARWTGGTWTEVQMNSRFLGHVGQESIWQRAVLERSSLCRCRLPESVIGIVIEAVFVAMIIQRLFQ